MNAFYFLNLVNQRHQRVATLYKAYAFTYCPLTVYKWIFSKFTQSCLNRIRQKDPPFILLPTNLPPYTQTRVRAYFQCSQKSLSCIALQPLPLPELSKESNNLVFFKML